MQETFGIAAFRSRQQVLLLEAALRREGLPVSVITTPRDVALGCGLSVRFSMEDLDRVERVIAAQKPTHLVGIYRVDRIGGRPRLSPVAIYR
ncbi:MAG: DUF3343 domain-containing protein [Christensenellales bacterium]|jgi:hypothetical protein